MASHPGLPQILTFGITASDSSGYDFDTRQTECTGIAGGSGWRCTSQLNRARSKTLVVPPIEPTGPGCGNNRSEDSELLAVAGDSVVTEVTTEFLAQYRVLFVDRAISAPLTP